MTREEAAERIETIKMILEECIEDEDDVSYITSDDANALDMAIKVLEQEPCEDCVSRQAVDKNIYDYAESNRLSYANMKNYILDVQPVTPTRNKGKWIESNYGNMISQHRWYCSECGGIHHDTETGEWRETFDFRYAYCPNCGSFMMKED